MARVTREQLWEAIEGAIADEPRVLAAWEGGSAATGRVDALSDLDLVLLVEPADVEAAFAMVEAWLAPLTAIDTAFRLPEPTWHGHAQSFLRLAGASPDHFVDLVVMARGAKDLFLQEELHGTPRIIVDRVGLEFPPPLERALIDRANRARVASIAVRHRVLGGLPDKERRRGRAIDALAFHQSITLRHLVELLRIEHDPARATFGLRYLDRDLPDPLRARLEALLFVADPAALAAAIEDANRWIDELLARADESE